jgi:hypothetical protein
MRVILTAIFVFVTLGETRGQQAAGEATCATNPKIVDACFRIRGRIDLYNGTPSFRIWRVGSRRVFGLLPAESPIVPAAVRPYLERLANEPGLQLFGNFTVCPFSPDKPGRMRDVCVESATDLVERRR